MTRPLISAETVQLAHEKGETTVPVGNALVTAAARDLAAELNITLSETPDNSETKDASGYRIAVGADHGGVDLKDALARWLSESGHAVTDVGTTGPGSVDYPTFAARVAEAVATGDADLGIMVDGAGIGSCMVANKIAGVRAAMCYDVTTAANAREHNHANVLTLGGTLIGERLAREIVLTFLDTSPGPDRHARRVAMIDALDGG